MGSSLVTITTKSNTKNEPEVQGDDDEVEYSSRTEPINRRSMKNPVAIVKCNVPWMTNFVRCKDVGKKN